MYKRITNLLKKYINEDKFYDKKRIADELYVVLLYVKYLCDNNIDGFSYDKITNESLDDIYNYLMKVCGYYVINDYFDIEKIIKLIQNKELKELIDDMFKNNEGLGINLIDKTEKKICLVFGYDFNEYDPYGNTIYIHYAPYINMMTFKLLDKLLGIENEYYFYKDYEISKNIKYVYINDKLDTRTLTSSKFSINPLNYVRDFIKQNKEVLLKTEYKKISYFNITYDLKPFIKRIILNSKYEKNESFILFNNKENKHINMILYDQIEIKEFYKIINKTSDNKYITNITLEDIKNNNNRIGFKLYKNNLKSNETKKINEIIDENKKMNKLLDSLDYNISVEVDKLINK